MAAHGGVVAQTAVILRSGPDQPQMLVAGGNVDMAGQYPSSACLTRTWARPSRRSANRAVKPAGICWAISTAGESGGSAQMICRNASTPPVDEPMATMESVPRSGPERAAIGVGAAAP
jgi:hypothetical protein